MKNILLIIQIVLGIALIGLVIIQGKGGGLSPAIFSSGFYSTRRGIEKLVFFLTIIVSVLFFVSSIAQLLI